jgi:hypothetical protein
MKGTFFNKPIEWNIETSAESWTQGSKIEGTLRVKNHGLDAIDLKDAGVGLAHADIKKVHAKSPGALKIEVKNLFSEQSLLPGANLALPFSLEIPANAPVSDKKGSFFLTYGRNLEETHLQLNVGPRVLFAKLIGLMDTFQRFKLKDYKSVKQGVEYKLIPPTSRDMANIETLLMTFSMEQENLKLIFDFQVKKLDTSGPTNKINKENVRIEKILSPKEYSLGKDMINQDVLLKNFESVLGEVKLKAVF